MSGLKLSVTSWGEVALDKRELRNLMRSAGNDVRNKTARMLAASQGSGRAYRGGGGAAYRGQYVARAYHASAPGEPPVAVSGTLRGSLRTYVYPTGEGFAVRERAFYAVFLEGGARGGGNPFGSRGASGGVPGRHRRHRARGKYTARVLAPRPALARVMAEQGPDLDRRVRVALAQALTWKQTKKL